MVFLVPKQIISLLIMLRIKQMIFLVLCRYESDWSSKCSPIIISIGGRGKNKEYAYASSCPVLNHDKKMNIITEVSPQDGITGIMLRLELRGRLYWIPNGVVKAARIEFQMIYRRVAKNILIFTFDGTIRYDRSIPQSAIRSTFLSFLQSHYRSSNYLK